MKVGRLCVLALVCLSVANAGSPSAGGKAAYTDTQEISHHVEDGPFVDSNNNVYVKKASDVTSEVTVTDNEASKIVSEEVKVPVTRIVNGKVITTYKKVTTKVDARKVVKHVYRTSTGTFKTASITSALLKYGAQLPQLTADSYIVFNSIAATDYGRFWSDYNFWEVNDEDLYEGLKQLTAVFKVPLWDASSSEEFDDIVASIKSCKEGLYWTEISSDSVDVNNKDGWKIHAQILMATCSKEGNKNQLFAWTGYKQGEYLPGQYSESNALTVKNTAKLWLLQHLPLLASCSNSPVKPMHIWNSEESSINDPFEQSASCSSESSSSKSGSGR